MDYYGKDPQEQAVQILIHDINQRTYGLRDAARKLRAGDFQPLALAQQLEATEKSVMRTIDEYLQKWKQFPSPANHGLPF